MFALPCDRIGDHRHSEEILPQLVEKIMELEVSRYVSIFLVDSRDGADSEDGVDSEEEPDAVDLVLVAVMLTMLE